MTEIALEPSSKSRLACLLGHFGTIPDPRDPRYVAHPLARDHVAGGLRHPSATATTST